MNVMETIRKNVVITDPSEKEIQYANGFLAGTYFWTKSLRLTGVAGIGLMVGGFVGHVVIPTCAPLCVRAWKSLKEVVSTRSVSPEQESAPAEVPLA